MKKEKIHSEEERQKPRLPEEGRERIRGGGAHKDKKKYDRKRDKKKRERETTERSPFLLFVFYGTIKSHV
jgi:hypothetical protein